MDQKTDTVDYPKVEESLAGTIEYMESIDNSYDLLKYCNEIVIKFDSNPTIGKLDLQAIKSVSDPSVPVLNQFTFPIIMKHGLMKLNDFKSPLDAITLFESLKSKSLHTFILGCGIKNYNKYIELQWSCFQDITKILNILEDLKINGIQGDLETEEILTTIKDEYADLLTEDSLTKSETFIWSERNEEDLKKLKKYIEDLSLYSSL
ncbi:hypothetical protein WICPIJ_005578 [Wickerhamomyces pijperi]|uniref:Mtf2-like C-terminal domain-containing protein n=1 Tax=Wickerhamomyces pijperi TaxID=599730 RepID=A0A9P8Q605_WICPI|nr:hypothetical protein WICPIJ_005578 [Wickerhamomyces pijperi]